MLEFKLDHTTTEYQLRCRTVDQLRDAIEKDGVALSRDYIRKDRLIETAMCLVRGHATKFEEQRQIAAAEKAATLAEEGELGFVNNCLFHLHERLHDAHRKPLIDSLTAFQEKLCLAGYDRYGEVIANYARELMYASVLVRKLDGLIKFVSDQMAHQTKTWAEIKSELRERLRQARRVCTDRDDYAHRNSDPIRSELNTQEFAATQYMARLLRCIVDAIEQAEKDRRFEYLGVVDAYRGI